ncbi:MSMEG_1061 family FMN-dependent PPOX-type flavoprotein [Streptomyces sp. NPDC001941]|uniref:MSMEG_1061 family FMN-dependent PPOX-type flavoprotein n=1 Tax=Streptomyces sp. NPDC001941 TaxID=3154659 RepID=UPI00331D140C
MYDTHPPVTSLPSAPAPAPVTPAPARATSGGPWREVRDEDELAALLGEPHPIVIDKVHGELTEGDLDILARSPLCVVSTSDADGNCDASPRGDDAGFVRALGPRTLVLPERPGNRRGDSLRNILSNPHVGLLHLVPGSPEVLRVNGRARVVSDAPFFDDLAADGKRPALAVVVEIDEIFLHCSQSLRRADLGWTRTPKARAGSAEN